MQISEGRAFHTKGIASAMTLRHVQGKKSQCGWSKVGGGQNEMRSETHKEGV